jgi:type IV secretory pathway TrbL component
MESDRLGILWAEKRRIAAAHIRHLSAIGAMVNGDGLANSLKTLGSCKRRPRASEASGQQSTMKHSGHVVR